MNNPNSQSSLDTWVDWLLHLHAQEIDLGLQRISKVAETMQLTRPAPLVITVAGTNGKGSSVAMLSAILQAAGYRVGTYTSPHIVSFTERVQINNVPVSEQLIVDAFDSIEQQRADTKLTYFEFSTLAALKIFTDTELDVVVLEVGLGGRLDAVNVVDADATLITAIDIDHIDWLGDDRSVIATEKAGVMRAQQLSVCSDPDVPNSLIEYANGLGVDLQLLGRDFNFSMPKKDDMLWAFKPINSEAESLEFALPALKGDFQIQNASGVVALLLAITQSNRFKYEVAQQAINQGLQAVSHPGRLQLKQVGNQSWLIDVAHNPQSAKVLAEYLAANQLQSQTAIFSALNDKDMLPMVQAISPYVDTWYIADLQIPRASSLSELREILLAAQVLPEKIIDTCSIAQAVEQVQQQDNNEAKQVLVWGSFFTVSQVLQVLD